MPVSAVQVQPANEALLVGETTQLSAILLGERGDVLGGRAVGWSSESPSVASVDPQGRVLALSVGEARIRASSEGVTGTATVRVLRGPGIQLSEPELEFLGISGRPNPMERQVSVTNSDGGVLTGLTVSVDPGTGGTPWLEATLLGSTAPTSLVVIARSMALEPGVYSGSVQVSSPVAENSPVILPVRLEVSAPPPELGLTPASVVLAGVTGDLEPASVTVDVENVGGGLLGSLDRTVRYPDGTASGWLQAELLGTQAPTGLVLRAFPGALAAGTYRASVEVSSPESATGPAFVEVTFNVSERIGGEPPPAAARSNGAGAREGTP